MIRRKSVISLAVLGVLSLCAVGVSSAAAATTGYTLHECVKVGSKGTGVEYNTECKEKATGGGFETLPISGPVKVKATGTSSFTLSATVGGVFFSITCTGLASEPTVNNVLTGETHHVTDEGPTKFTGCGVTAPAEKKCHVPSTLETVNLKSDTDDSGNTKFTPASGETFITIPVTECTVAALNGEKPVKGFAQSSRENATTQVFSSTSGSSLTFGGQAATFTGKYHLSTTNGTSLYLDKAGE